MTIEGLDMVLGHVLVISPTIFDKEGFKVIQSTLCSRSLTRGCLDGSAESTFTLKLPKQSIGGAKTTIELCWARRISSEPTHEE